MSFLKEDMSFKKVISFMSISVDLKEFSLNLKS